MPRTNTTINTGGRATYQEYTWGKPEGEGFNASVSSFSSNDDDNPQVVTWTLGVGADLTAASGLTPLYQVPRNAHLNKLSICKKTAASGIVTIGLRYATAPDGAFTTVLPSSLVLASGAYEGTPITTFAVPNLGRGDVLAIDCISAPVSTRDVTVVLDMSITE